MATWMTRSPVLDVATQARTQGIYPYFKDVNGRPGPSQVVVDGTRAVDFASSDYLGLATDPRVTRAAADGAAQWGTSCSGSQCIAGTFSVHRELEEELADFLRRDAVLLTATGYQANLALACLFDQSHLVLADRHNHASLMDAVRLGRAGLRSFRHNDTAHAVRLLEEGATAAGLIPLIVTEGAFSLGGAPAPLPLLAAAAHHRRGALIVDGAHDIGVYGAGGRGMAEHLACEAEVDVLTGTFSKAIGSVGGFIAGPHDVIATLRHLGRASVYAAALPPPAAAAALAALRIVRSEPERRETLWRNAEHLHRRLAGGQTLSAGVPTPRATTAAGQAGPVATVPVPSGPEAMHIWRALLDAGVYAALFLPPSTPDGPLLRLSVTASHTTSQIEDLTALVHQVLSSPTRV
ncbi:pyridoxal phosphate-dependent aminotransferase family protein [Streptomyces lavendulae]|uniref:aminotransferase class I/II-fold pyridoxal phosphate-dependent enzyme n=1 Tax=Streptomyces lavendulae TaxID=1914 RepID=UPI0033C0CC7B